MSRNKQFIGEEKDRQVLEVLAEARTCGCGAGISPSFRTVDHQFSYQTLL